MIKIKNIPFLRKIGAIKDRLWEVIVVSLEEKKAVPYKG